MDTSLIFGRTLRLLCCLVYLTLGGTVSAAFGVDGQKKIVASDGDAGDDFGVVLDVDGNTAVMSARGDDDQATDAGAAFVLGKDQGGTNNWGEVKKLTASDGALDDGFGSGVSISGDLVAVGAAGDDHGGVEGLGRGSVYIFKRNEGGTDNWGQVKKITANDAEKNDGFGGFVVLVGETLAVTALLEDEAATDAGAVYVFRRDQGGSDNWGEVKKITGSDSGSGDQFGVRLALHADEDLLVVGANMDDEIADNAGAAFVFGKDDGGTDNWGEVKKITADDGEAEDQFGADVTVSVDTLVVGAGLADPGQGPANANNGVAYIFERNQGGTDNWGKVKKIVPHDANVDGCCFGVGLALSTDENTLVVGRSRAKPRTDPNDPNTGAIYIFGRNQGGTDNWGEQKKLVACDWDGADFFGNDVALTGNDVFVGAHEDDDNGTDSGAAYIMDGQSFECTTDSCMQDELILPETVVADGETDSHEATVRIQNSGDYTVESGGAADWTAGEELILHPGFLVETGGTFDAVIDAAACE